MSSTSLSDRNAALAEKLGKKLGIGGADLGAKIGRAGRDLPRRLRRQGRVLTEAEALAGHPKLSRQIDVAAIDAAYRALDDHLDAIDPVQRRWTRVLGILAVISFNLLLFAAMLIALLAWRGDIGLG